MRISRFAWALVALAFVATGCKASKEDVIKEWKVSEAAVGTYTTKYAAFATVLKSTLDTQKKSFDAASKDKGDVEKMKAAHAPLAAVVAPITAYESKSERIRKLMSDRRVLKQGGKARVALEKGNKKLVEAAGVVAAAKDIKSAADLQKTFGAANTLLDEALQPLERLARKGSKKKKRRKGKRKKRR